MPNNDVVQLFTDLVRIDSPSGTEGDMAVYIADYLKPLSISSTLDAAGNLYAQITGLGEPVILNAHMDTVEPGRGISPQIKDGVITGDGTTILGADNKVALAAILSALIETSSAPHRALELVFSVREETDSGIAAFDFTKLQSKTGLVADRASPIGSIVTSSPWIMNLNIQITGVSSHAGRPEEGVNALSIAAQAISATRWGRINPQTTSNLGLISGGSAMNTVPGAVDLVGEIRSFSKDSLMQLLINIREKFSRICSDSHAKCDFVSNWYCPGYIYSESDPAIREIQSVMAQLKITTFFETAFGASDANVFANHGIHVVCIGDGCTNPHTKQESVTVANLQLLKNLILNYIIKPNE